MRFYFNPHPALLLGPFLSKECPPPRPRHACLLGLEGLCRNIVTNLSGWPLAALYQGQEIQPGVFFCSSSRLRSERLV